MNDPELTVTLEEATLDQIVDELERRYRTVVVVTLKDAEGAADTPDDVLFCDWRGGSFTAIGLCERVVHRIQNVLDREDE